MEEHPHDVYLFNDYDGGGFDMYEGEPILFMDEFKGGIRFQTLLNLLDSYRIQLHCRYANTYALWTEVHISSVFPPDEAYKFMVEADARDRDPASQLLRRLDSIIFHYKSAGEFKVFTMPASEYKNYDQLKELALKDTFIDVNTSPFDICS